MNEPQNPPWTAGPWYVDADYPCNVSTADHRTIAETCDSWFNLEISRANARLIAAAPELVAALEACVDPDDCSWDHNGNCQAHYDFDKPHECYNAAARALLVRVRGDESISEEGD